MRIRTQVGNNDPQKKTKVKKCIVLKVLDVIFLGLEASPVDWTSFMGHSRLGINNV
jgi:hypothetical protein